MAKTKTTKSQNRFSALTNVQRFFPKTRFVRDADKNVIIEVTKADVSASARRAHEGCAMAVACKRKLKVDGVIISRSIAYVVKGKKALRYFVPASVAREVVAFDRGASFEPGSYVLRRPDKSSRLGHMKGGHNRDNEGRKKHNPEDGPRHVTQNVRTSLAEKQ